MTLLSTNKEERKKHPIFRGVLMYFPRTIVSLAKCSWLGNEQHNKGEPLHWAREKSNDHEDCALRHMMEGDSVDDDGVYHCVKAAWRMLARAELILEKAATQNAEETLDELREGLERVKDNKPWRVYCLDPSSLDQGEVFHSRWDTEKEAQESCRACQDLHPNMIWTYRHRGDQQ